MDALIRWMKREEPPGGVLAAFAAIGCGTILVIGLIAAALDPTVRTDPLGPIVFCALMAVLTAIFTAPALKHLKAKKLRGKSPSLAPLQAAAFAGNLEAALAGRFGVISQAATDLEQLEALLKTTHLESPMAEKLRSEGNHRLRRMLDLTLAPPGQLGYSTNGAEQQVKADGRWLAEVLRLVEAGHDGPEIIGEDTILANLKSLIAEREEAINELRA